MRAATLDLQKLELQLMQERKIAKEMEQRIAKYKTSNQDLIENANELRKTNQESSDLIRKQVESLDRLEKENLNLTRRNHRLVELTNDMAKNIQKFTNELHGNEPVVSNSKAP